jgi:hypothetical protein
MKVCIDCNNEKTLDHFTVKSGRVGQYNSYCKVCASIRRKKHYENNKERNRQLVKEWRTNNPEKTEAIKHRFISNNPNWRAEYQNSYNKRRSKVDVNFKLTTLLRSRLYKAISNNYKSGSAVSNLGCSIENLKMHLQSKFQPSMTWDNHGDWHVDHIIPLSKFDLSNPEEMKIACHYSNLQPLWAKENISKGGKYD